MPSATQNEIDKHSQTKAYQCLTPPPSHTYSTTTPLDKTRSSYDSHPEITSSYHSHTHTQNKNENKNIVSKCSSQSDHIDADVRYKTCNAIPISDSVVFDSSNSSVNVNDWERHCWPEGRKGMFVNYGLKLWEKQRQQWLSGDFNVFADNNNSSSIAIANANNNSGNGIGIVSGSGSGSEQNHSQTQTAKIYEDMIQGLISTDREYELPYRVSLASIIDLYVDIWDAQDDC